MAGGIDQIDEVVQAALTVAGVGLEIEGDTGGLDGHTTLLLIRAGIGETVWQLIIQYNLLNLLRNVFKVRKN